MDYQIITHEGFTVRVDGGPEIEVFAAQLNDRRLYALSLANSVLAKSIFKTVVLADADNVGAYEVHTMDGGIFLTDISDYDPAYITDRINDVENEFTLIGNVIVQRHNFKMVREKQADMMQTNKK